MTIINTAVGADERRDVDSSIIYIPDLWHVATYLKEEARRSNANFDKMQLAEWADFILDTWHLAHDMKKTLDAL